MVRGFLRPSFPTGIRAGQPKPNDEIMRIDPRGLKRFDPERERPPHRRHRQTDADLYSYF
jgi:hypothetical protein